MAVLRDSEIDGKRVITEDALDVGTIVDIFVDTQDWRITKFDLRLEKRYAERIGVESGLLKKAIIPVKLHNVRSVGDVVNLKGSIEDLKRSVKSVALPTKDEGKKKKKKGKEPPAEPTPPPKYTQPPARPAPPTREEDYKPRKL